MKLLFGMAVALLLAEGGRAILAQEPGELPPYASMLPQVKARALPVDPQKGYYVAKLKPDVYMITDGGYQALFVTTGRGVVLFDAPPSMATHISKAIAETTKEPLTTMVYSHIHVDHIGGAGVVAKEHPGLAILAERGVADFLREQRDPHRPVPTQVFDKQETLHIGSMTAELRVGYWHDPEGDLFIYFPDKKVLMAVDAYSAGSVPFMGLDLTQNMDAYLKSFDQFLAYDFDVMVPGHHGSTAKRSDTLLAKQYVFDVFHTAAGTLTSQDHSLANAAVKKYGRENSYPVARVVIDDQVKRCASAIVSRWAAKLDNVDVWAPSHCQTALVYAEWDVGQR